MFSFVLGHMSGIAVGVCLIIIGKNLWKKKKKRSQHDQTDATNVEASGAPSQNIIYEDISEATITKPSGDVPLQENVAYGHLR